MAAPSRLRRAARPRPAGKGEAWRAAKRPWHVLLIAFGLLLLQGPSLFHLLLVPHATCEHGELIEGRVAAGPLSATPRAHAARSDRAQIELSQGDGAGHDHCDALAVRHQIPEVGASVVAASLLCITPIEGCVAHPETRPVPLLSLAPKSSPPAA